MAQIDYRIGDMFKGGHKYIAHGCNAQGVMGSGVAAIVKRKYYYAFKKYNEEHQKNGLRLGQVIRASVSHGKYDHCPPTIFNCITQNNYGTDQRYANYGAIQSCIKAIEEEMFLLHGCVETPEVAFPMIGAGLAGGDWGIISEIIEKNSTYFQPVVYDFTP